MTIDPARDALLVVDLQNDFCPGGALGVRGGDAIVPVVNRYIERFAGAGAPVFLTRDWHPAVTRHFQAYGGVGPPHCVQGTPGAAFHPGLEATKAQMIVRKGFHTGIDSYSAFRENDRMTRTGLDGYLKARGFTRLIFCGLALDYFVAWSAIKPNTASENNNQ